MKNKFVLCIVFCISSGLVGAGLEEVPEERTLAIEKIDADLEVICKNMEKHSKVAGADEYQRLQKEKGLAPDDAITQLCYNCTRAEFESAVAACRRELVKVLIVGNVQGILSAFNLEDAIRVALKAEKEKESM